VDLWLCHRPHLDVLLRALQFKHVHHPFEGCSLRALQLKVCRRATCQAASASGSAALSLQHSPVSAPRPPRPAAPAACTRRAARGFPPRAAAEFSPARRFCPTALGLPMMQDLLVDRLDVYRRFEARSLLRMRLACLDSPRNAYRAGSRRMMRVYECMQ